MPHLTRSPRLWWERHGEQGPPVLLIMGFAMRAALWSEQIKALRPDHRVVIFDHQGMGASEEGRGPLSMRDMAADALRVMDVAGLSDAHVVGVSMGGMVAQELALNWPERVRTLSLLVTHAGHAGAHLPPKEGLSALLASQRGSPKQRAAALERLLYPDDFLATVDREVLRARVASRLESPPRRRAVLRQLGALLRHRTVERLHRLTLPTLVIRAGQDRMVAPIFVQRLAQALPEARLVNLEEAGHGVIFQCAEEVNFALREQIAGWEAQAGASVG